MQLYAQAQRIVVEDAPYLFLSDVNYLLPMSPKLQGFEFNGMYINSVDPVQAERLSEPCDGSSSDA